MGMGTSFASSRAAEDAELCWAAGLLELFELKLAQHIVVVLFVVVAVDVVVVLQ